MFPKTMSIKELLKLPLWVKAGARAPRSRVANIHPGRTLFAPGQIVNAEISTISF